MEDNNWHSPSVRIRRTTKRLHWSKSIKQGYAILFIHKQLKSKDEQIYRKQRKSWSLNVKRSREHTSAQHLGHISQTGQLFHDHQPFFLNNEIQEFRKDSKLCYLLKLSQDNRNKKRTVEPFDGLLSLISILVTHKGKTPRLTSPSSM